MLDFNYMVSTKVLFGKNKIERLGEELKQYGKNILFVYGRGSIKKNGLYDSVTNIFSRNSIVYHELPGVQPNPRITSVRQGIKLCREQNIECIVAVGGGSVIDCAKTIAAGFYHEGDPWDLFLLGDSTIKKALPIGTILTFAGTGSEMNGNAVISNEETEQKLAIHNDVLRPRFSILDPTYTFTVPRNQTAAGTVDIFSHILEQYFSPTKDAFVQNRVAESLLKTCIYYGPIALTEPTNYEARAQLMWTSSLALNGLLSYGRITDWATHGIEHAVSAAYDVTHGAGLAILTPYWMQYVLSEETTEKFVEYAQNVWQVKGKNDLAVARKGIEKTREFFTDLGMPKTLRDVGVQENKLEDMAEKTVLYGDVGKFKKLGKNDVLTILKNAF
ncbi:MAG: iron-containing alcohol dehydrogenase [Thermoplasmata archaeon]|nr:iron-containing alcohol dehydrogenase [Thermoplasmata archaeon]